MIYLNKKYIQSVEIEEISKTDWKYKPDNRYVVIVIYSNEKIYKYYNDYTEAENFALQLITSDSDFTDFIGIKEHY